MIVDGMVLVKYDEGEETAFHAAAGGQSFPEVLGPGYYVAERLTQIGFVLSPVREIDEVLQQPRATCASYPPRAAPAKHLLAWNSPRHPGLTGDHHNPHSQV